jgi:hypothetical protein
MAKLCLKCGNTIKISVVINGKHHNLCSRKYCLDCSPFKAGNTAKLHLGESANKHYKKYKDLTPEKRKLHNQKSYEDQKATREKKKRALIALKGGKCESCGYDRCPAVLQFHHIDPSTKLFNMSYREISSIKWEKILEEVDKCQLLCANCHTETHYKQKRQSLRPEPRPLPQIPDDFELVIKSSTLESKCKDGQNMASAVWNTATPYEKMPTSRKRTNKRRARETSF